ncbi:MAG TPA: DUF2793 domain-containing protein [Pararhodobacter sp.]|uniref:DUF2793 domain-containing protein n=1 Tax=Pararhodobacter sp. TaxID=2127056 RepID=UPI002D015B48|nr:DUF2793 domain-containing protein [Pararhodobacter sp.]HPD93242.1 DUF2793 domain-containing protein [Pararhodobacter sp.]
MSFWSANLKLPYMAAAQAQKHVTHNEALERLDSIVQLTVTAFDATTPPLSATDGEVWALGYGAVNDWAGHDLDLAVWSNGGWLFVTPHVGWRAALGTDLRVFDGSGWVSPDLPDLQNLPGLGVGTSYDTVNKLAVQSEASLFTHQGAGHQIKVNKNAAGDTASLLFQTGWSGRAEMGTQGSDAFGIKVSADGTAWHTALAFDPATALPQGEAVCASPIDATAGRLLTVGGFGLGGPLAATPTADNPNSIAASGFYQVSGSALMPSTGGFCLQHLRRSASQQTQIAWPDAAPGLSYQRYHDGTTWSGWQQFNSTLGPVAQSGGVPTGAIIERGSNANGEYVRFADGTQICQFRQVGVAITTASVGGLYRSAAIAWTFPAAFVLGSINGATIHARITNNAGLSVNVPYGGRTTQATGALAYAISSVADTEIFWLATGRWF